VRWYEKRDIYIRLLVYRPMCFYTTE